MSKPACPESVFDATPQTLRALLDGWGEPAYRASQILDWVYRRGACCYDEMTNLPKRLRAWLAGELPVYESNTVRQRESRDGTIKLLLGWPDGATCECVLIPDGARRTACLSTQVGCPARCVFCASGLDGLQRQLSAGQIVEQAMRLRRLCGNTARLSHVVFMGSGEPLANYEATVRAVRTLNAAWGMGIGARRITVSTVGLPGPMGRLAREGLQITLALSLHAPTDSLRRALIPWAQHVTIESLIEAAHHYFEHTGREVTLEYVLLGGVNDAEDHARRLAALSRRVRGNVNLIAYHPVDGLAFRPPSDRNTERFLATLRGCGVNAHLRRNRGLDIDAACGQLRHAAHPQREQRDP